MMRWVIFSAVVVALTALATVGATYFAPGESDVPSAVPVAPKVDGPVGAVEVEGSKTVFDFGIMPQATEGKHEWTIVNKGSGPVKLSNGGETCSCTNGSIPKGEQVAVEPGGSFKMTVTWNTKTWSHFHQIATVYVANDPATPKLEFVIDGEVKPPVVTMPSADTKIDFLSADNGEAHPRMIGVASHDRPEMKVTAVKANPELFSTEVQPLTPEECKAMKVEKGSKVIVSLKAGAPIGPFTEELVIETDHPKRPEVKFSMAGKVEGPIRFSPDRVRMFVPAREGGSETLTFWVRGRKETKFTVAKKPEALDIAIAPMSTSGDATQYRFTVTVPPGRLSGPPLNDTIILKTDHPQAAEVKIPVAVVVRAS